MPQIDLPTARACSITPSQNRLDAPSLAPRSIGLMIVRGSLRPTALFARGREFLPFEGRGITSVVNALTSAIRTQYNVTPQLLHWRTDRKVPKSVASKRGPAREELTRSIEHTSPLLLLRRLLKRRVSCFPTCGSCSRYSARSTSVGSVRAARREGK